MGFRYRKSINLGAGAKLNIGKKGIGVSAGVKGLRVSHGADGKTRVTASIPTTGISYQKVIKHSNQEITRPQAIENINENTQKNLISAADKLILGSNKLITTFHGKLEQYYENNIRDTYYEKYANVTIYEDRIDVEYANSNTAAFSMEFSEDVKFQKMIDKKGFFFKKLITRLRIYDNPSDPDLAFWLKDITFILSDEGSADKIINIIEKRRF